MVGCDWDWIMMIVDNHIREKILGSECRLSSVWSPLRAFSFPGGD